MSKLEDVILRGLRSAQPTAGTGAGEAPAGTIMFITDEGIHERVKDDHTQWESWSPSRDAADVAYDNATSGLTATDVQAAIDELEEEIDGVSGGSGYPEGTSFPGGPSTNDKFYRTDLNMLFYYDGTRWVSTQLNEIRLVNTDGLLAFTSSAVLRGVVPVWAGSDIWLVSAQAWFYVGSGTALSASHKWVGTVNDVPGATTHATFTIDSGALDTHRQTSRVDIGALLGATDFMLESGWTKTGTPGGLYVQVVVSYRYVAT